jgi:hypothetical protein
MKETSDLFERAKDPGQWSEMLELLISPIS